MHRQHGQALRHFDFTLAVIDREADRGGLNDEEYYRDVIHRHAHRMATQAQGAIWSTPASAAAAFRWGKSTEVWR